jgi:hypothetical protein
VYQQAASANIIQNSTVGIFFPKTEGTKTKAARVLISWLPSKFESLHLPTYNFNWAGVDKKYSHYQCRTASLFLFLIFLIFFITLILFNTVSFAAPQNPLCRRTHGIEPRTAATTSLAVRRCFF